MTDTHKTTNIGNILGEAFVGAKCGYTGTEDFQTNLTRLRSSLLIQLQKVPGMLCSNYNFTNHRSYVNGFQFHQSQNLLKDQSQAFLRSQPNPVMAMEVQSSCSE